MLFYTEDDSGSLALVSGLYQYGWGMFIGNSCQIHSHFQVG